MPRAVLEERVAASRNRSVPCSRITPGGTGEGLAAYARCLHRR